MLVISILPHYPEFYIDSYKLVLEQYRNPGCAGPSSTLQLHDFQGWPRKRAEELADALGKIICDESTTQLKEALKFISDHTRGYMDIPYMRLESALRHCQEQVVKVRIFDPEKEAKRKAAEAEKLKAKREVALENIWREEAQEKIDAFMVEMGTTMSDLVRPKYIDAYVEKKRSQRSNAGAVAKELLKSQAVEEMAAADDPFARAAQNQFGNEECQ